MNKILILGFLLIGLTSQAQFTDDFEDGDFTTGTVWSGNTSLFTVASGELQSQSPGAANYYLSTPSTLATEAIWEFYANLKFSTSGANYVDFYLMADNADLTAAANGYFVRMGNTADEVSLYMLESGTPTIIIDGTDGIVNSSSNNPFNIKVTRDASNLWTLQVDDGALGAYTTEGTVTDNTITTSTHFGIRIEQSTAAGPINNHYFDNFSVAPIPVDNTAPILTGITQVSVTELDVQFDEVVEQTTAETASNYVVDGGIGTATNAVRDGSDNTLVHLTFGNTFTNGQSYALTVQNVEDTNGNAITTLVENFDFLIPELAEAGDILINEFMPDPTPTNGLPEQEFVEIFNASDKYINLLNYTLSDALITDVDYILEPGEYLILCDDANVALFETYGTVLAVNAWNTLTNTGETITLKDVDNDLVIDQLTYDLSWYADDVKEDGGYSLELINPESPCGGSNNWTASNDVSGGTPGTQNSVYDTTPDTAAPELLSASAIKSDSLVLVFSESLDAATLLPVNFSISPSANINTITANEATVSVTLSGTLTSGVLYTITISNIADCWGNVISAPLTSNFRLPDVPIERDILINEFMADPTPAIDLPESEFIELYNTSNKYFNLAEFTINGEAIAIYELAPGAHVILCPIAFESEFAAFGATLGLTSWDALTNAGETIALKYTPDNLVVDELTYDLSWYGDDVKEDGGYSLELINPESPCSGKSNWTGSSNTSGGTPGSQNSVYDTTPDTTAPEFVTLNVLAADSLVVAFNEALDESTTVPGNFVFDPALAISEIVTDEETVGIKLASGLSTGTLYTLTISNIADCWGNAIATNVVQSFRLPDVPEEKDIIINEFMPDPTEPVGLPESEFVEIYNRSAKYFDIAEFTINGKTITTGRFELAPNEYVILCPEDFQADFSSLGKTIGLTSWDALTNSGETIMLHYTPSDFTVDEITYDLSWYRNETKDDGGYSLELINPDSPCSGKGNWIASTDLTGGTPGIENSVFDTTPDTQAPQLFSVTAIKADSVVLAFNEVLNQASASLINFSISPAVAISAAVLKQETISLELSTALSEGTLYSITVVNITDCWGNTMASSESQEFRLYSQPVWGDILVTEIMAQPSDETSVPDAEYIELFNNSDKFFNLAALQLNGHAISSELYEFGSGEYVVLFDEDDEMLFDDYENGKAMQSWNSLSDDGETVVLQFEEENVLHAVAYTSNWYKSITKDDGGYSLEMLDPANFCSGATNWTVTTDPRGGTPGIINSVDIDQPDLTAPLLMDILAANDTTILLRFNEVMDSSAITLSNFALSNGISLNTASFISLEELQLTTQNALTNNTTYQVELSNVKDCNDNLYVTAELVFELPRDPESGDLVLNEVLFDARSGAPDFVEVYNNSNKYINIKDWRLTNRDDDGTLDNIKNISELPNVVRPGHYMVFTRDPLYLANEYPAGKTETFLQLQSIPSYSNDKGSVVILTPDFEIYEEFDYTDDMHHSLLNSVDGVSLERISLTGPTNDGSNWHSAASTVLATPGYLNSQSAPAVIAEDVFTISPQVFVPDQNGMDDFTTIRYAFEQPGYIVSIKIIDDKGRLIKTITENTTLPVTGEFRWDGTTNDGTKARIGSYLVFIEAFDGSGNVKHYRERVVVGSGW